MDNVPETRQKLSIFLSHSHKDIEKVRKLRDILEFLDCEPLMFYLKCLDENNDELNTFIMREIEARNIFIYCKSKNSESSAWVQKELAYIRSLDSKRLYTVDIDGNLAYGMLGVLEKVVGIIKKNRVFLSYSRTDGRDTARALCDLLRKEGYSVFLDEDSLPVGGDWGSCIANEIDEVAKNGVFLPVITPGYVSSQFCRDELNYAMKADAAVVPFVVGDVDLPVSWKMRLGAKQMVRSGADGHADSLLAILQALRALE